MCAQTVSSCFTFVCFLFPAKLWEGQGAGGAEGGVNQCTPEFTDS